MARELAIASRGEVRCGIAISDSAHSAEKQAAEDLRLYLEAATGCEVPTSADGTPGDALTVWIGKSGAAQAILKASGIDLSAHGPDAYAIAVSEQGGVLCGNRPRATAYAVYDLLTQIGFRFYEPTDYGEVIPRLTDVSLPLSSRVEEPDKPFRELDIDLGLWDGLEWEFRIIRWALKNRLNVIGISPFHRDFCRLIHCFPELVREVKRLDLDLCVGGHGSAMFQTLPEELADLGTKPADFAEFIAVLNRNKAERPHFYGSRGTDPLPFEQTNGEPFPCLSRPEVVEQMVATTLALFERFPEIDIFRLAGNDACRECQCDACQATDGFDRHMDLARQLAARTGERFPGKRIALTLQGNAGVREAEPRACDLPENVILWYGLENESYIGPLTGKAGEDRMRHRERVRRHERFAEACGRSCVIKEMHGSGLYRRLYCPAPHVIQANQRFFRAECPRWIGTHVFVNPSQNWHQWTLNFLAHYNLLWDPEFGLDAALSDYVESFFGPAAETMAEVLRILEEYGPVAAYAVNSAYYSARDTVMPPYGDWLELLPRAAEELGRAARLAEEALRMPLPAECRVRLRDEVALLTYTVGWTRVLVALFSAVRCLAQAECLAEPQMAERLRAEAEEWTREAEDGWQIITETYSVRRAVPERFPDNRPEECPYSAADIWEKAREIENIQDRVRELWPL